MAQAYEINLVNLVEKFGSDDKCRAYLEALRWPGGVKCPRCQSDKISRIHDRGQFDCDSCRYQFSVTSGTMMHDTKLPLWKWFLAIYMMVESKKGVSANQLKRSLCVSYRTAWYLCHRIRKALETPDVPMEGTVEVDGSYVGGRLEGRGQGCRSDNKTLILGAIARETKQVRMKSVREDGNTESKKSVGKFVRAHISNEATIYTDHGSSMRAGVRGHGKKHETVNHLQNEWIRGDIHTNGVEGAWSLFKRSVIGSFHQVSMKHLPAYLDEFEFRFNNRDNPYIFRDAMLEVIRAENVEYRDLVA